jgi:hypothetical protein
LAHDGVSIITAMKKDSERSGIRELPFHSSQPPQDSRGKQKNKELSLLKEMEW